MTVTRSKQLHESIRGHPWSFPVQLHQKAFWGHQMSKSSFLHYCTPPQSLRDLKTFDFSLYGPLSVSPIKGAKIAQNTNFSNRSKTIQTIPNGSKTIQNHPWFKNTF